MVQLGINKVRLTGGEPLMRGDLEQIVARIATIEGIRDLTMTTNAQDLASRAAGLKKAGLMRVNISLDSLKAEVYREITGGGDVSRVFAGLDAALSCGLTPIKVNCVLLRGTNDGEIDDFIALARDNPLHIRFIELMPMGGMRDDTRRVPTGDILTAHPELQPIENGYAGQPSRDYCAPGFRGTVGFISPVSRVFCQDCSRIRVTSDANLRPCLGDNREIDLRDGMRQGDQALLDIIRRGVYEKPRGHHFSPDFVSERKMNRIGG
jgi:cyclic pyranopterin phosphate synthase